MTSLTLCVAGGAHLGHVLHPGQQQLARILRLAARVGALLGSAPPASPRASSSTLGRPAPGSSGRGLRLQVHALQQARHVLRHRAEQLSELVGVDVQRGAVARQQGLPSGVSAGFAGAAPAARHCPC
jgi:hypothetical protein